MKYIIPLLFLTSYAGAAIAAPGDVNPATYDPTNVINTLDKTLPEPDRQKLTNGIEIGSEQQKTTNPIRALFLALL